MQFNTLRYQEPKTKTYLGSPSIVRLSDGKLLATHDYFGPGCPLNHEGEEHLTSVYRSSDGGETWTNVTHIANAFWSSLFAMDLAHQAAVYLVGTSQQSGSIVIRRSTDGGYTWTHPFDDEAASAGILFKGGTRKVPPNYHCAPVPVLVKDGRLYRAFEDNTPYHWPQGFQACVISANTDTDLLDAANWTMSDKLPFDPVWLPESWGPWSSPGWLEGNVVEGPQGDIWNILRLNAKRPGDDGTWTLWNKAAMVKVEDEGHHLSFDPTTGFIDLPGGHSKFTIRRDAKTGRYFTISNGVMDPARPTLRSVLSLYQSSDLRNWEHCTVLLEDDTGLPYKEAARLIGFQYVDWQFDGDAIIYLVRTAYDGAHNFHDANRITFHRLENFRRWI